MITFTPRGYHTLRWTIPLAGGVPNMREREALLWTPQGMIRLTLLGAEEDESKLWGWMLETVRQDGQSSERLASNLIVPAGPDQMEREIIQTLDLVTMDLSAHREDRRAGAGYERLIAVSALAAARVAWERHGDDLYGTWRDPDEPRALYQLTVRTERIERTGRVRTLWTARLEQWVESGEVKPGDIEGAKIAGLMAAQTRAAIEGQRIADAITQRRKARFSDVTWWELCGHRYWSSPTKWPRDAFAWGINEGEEIRHHARLEDVHMHAASFFVHSGPLRGEPINITHIVALERSR
jgi:hypothetical protein